MLMTRLHREVNWPIALGRLGNPQTDHFRRHVLPKGLLIRLAQKGIDDTSVRRHQENHVKAAFSFRRGSCFDRCT